MASPLTDFFTISDLQELNLADYNWFSEESARALAGRCLLDVLEYVRNIPPFSARFRELANAHAVRLLCRFLDDPSLNKQDFVQRIKPSVLDICRQLRERRKTKVPHYGDDFWDWAAILEAFVQVEKTFPGALPSNTLLEEIESYYNAVKARIETGLTTGITGEWYGPATSAIAHRLLSAFKSKLPAELRSLLKELRGQALERIEKNQYRDRPVEDYQVLWHYGQVVTEFPSPKLTSVQAKTLGDLSVLDALETGPRTYALCRALEGSRKIKNQQSVDECLEKLYPCQNLARPLGEGLLCDNVKGSLNVLEAVWPSLSAAHKKSIGAMTDALLRARIAANTVGIVVAISNELETLQEEFERVDARVTETQGTLSIERAGHYRAIVCQGKSLVAAFDAARTLIETHRAKWIIMCGIAGSLGKPVQTSSGGVQFVGADLGDLVIASASTPFQIRDKVREIVENSKVPFAGSTWMVIPTDPMLFRLAHLSAEEMFGESKTFYEGLIVSGTGIKDSAAEKQKILKASPGGMAVEEEGYPIALLCLSRRVPFLNIRGISDRAHGDKGKQGIKEKNLQRKAGRIAAKLTVKVVERLSRQW